MIEFACPKCSGPLAAPDEQAGTMVACRHCSEWITVPHPEFEDHESDLSVRCPLCAQDISLRPSDAGMTLSCPHCGALLQVERNGAPHALRLRPARTGPETQPTPWEHRVDSGVLKAIWRTFKSVAFRPGAFYRHMSTYGAAGTSFAIWTNLIAATVSWTVGFVASLVLARGANPTPPIGPGFFSAMFCGLLGVFIVIPVITVVGLLLHAAISHLILRVTGNARSAFAATCDVVGYSTAVNLFTPIPHVGHSLAQIWSAVLTAVGLREVHKTNIVLAAIAAVAPRILLMLLWIGICIKIWGPSVVYRLFPWWPW